MPLAPNLTPNTYYFEKVVTTPANTGDLATSFDLGLTILESVQVLWPPGQNALIGVALALDGVWVLPWNQTGQFIFDSNERRDFSIGLLLDHPVVVHTHNATKAAHQTFLTFVTTDVPLPGDAPATQALPLLMP